MKGLLLAALTLALASCTSSLPVYETRLHVVQPGETLYTIAWRHGLDYRDLARWNGMDNPDLILVGQRIRLSPAAGSTGARSSNPAAGRAVPPAAGPPRSGSAPSAAVPPAGSAPRRPPADAAPTWRWPTEGQVVSGFGTGDGIGSGIAIGGRFGQPIYAAAAGSIVYAGSGLIGYGQLVIIKHNDTYLSAYGYNSRLEVEQGQLVTQGQKVAEMGMSSGRQPRLHFEIRRNGTPVDPLVELSAR